MRPARHGIFVVSLFYATIHHAIFTSAMVTLIPVQLKLSDVSLQYPETWFRRFVSAVPRREYALENLTFSVSKELVLITGNSDSGKTTMFKLILGDESPTSGSLILSHCANHDPDQRDDFDTQHLPKPVYLELQPDRSDTRATTLDILQSRLFSLLAVAAVEEDEGTSLASVIPCFCDLLVYSDNALQQKRDQLSASDNFKLEIILACLESVFGEEKYEERVSGGRNVRLPAPVLLLDEWLDKETTAVVHRVQEGMCRLAAAGAVICVVTHKPERWNLDHVRRLQLHRGRVDKDIPVSDSSVPS